MESMSFISTLQQDIDGTWWYVQVPKGIRDTLKPFEKRGIIPVSVTVGSSTWDGSMLPWADGSAQISIPKKCRSKENVGLGDSLRLVITPRPRKQPH